MIEFVIGLIAIVALLASAIALEAYRSNKRSEEQKAADKIAIERFELSESKKPTASVVVTMLDGTVIEVGPFVSSYDYGYGYLQLHTSRMKALHYYNKIFKNATIHNPKDGKSYQTAHIKHVELKGVENQ